jgi:hypothetical protein
VRIACGDWQRVLGPSVTVKHGLTGIYLDPPYRESEHSFGYVAGGGVWEACWAWAMQQASHPQLRLVVSGYADDRALPCGWTAYPWKAKGGYGSQGNGRARVNCRREVLYCSPHCEPLSQQLTLFDD